MKKPSMIKKIFSFLLKVVVVMLLMCCFCAASFEGVTYYLTGELYDLRELLQKNETAEVAPELSTEASVEENKDVENTLLFVDSQDGMSEYVILSMLNTKTNALDIILLPENAQIQVSKDIQKELTKKLSGVSRMVEIRDVERAFAEEKYDMISSIVEEMLHIKIHGWDHMTAKQAITFLNTVKPIEIDINHSISYRDNKGVLNILEEGEKEMDGKEAMTYLSYLDGTNSQESNRLERTNAYMETFLSHLVTLKSSKIMEAFQNNSKSSKDRKFDALAEALKASNMDFITLRILQGSESDNSFVIDSQKAQLQIATLIKQAESFADGRKNDDSEDNSDDYSFDGESGDSKDLSIEIYNAAYVRGIASEWEYFLEDEGYHITIVDTYQQEGPISTTRVILEREGIGQDLIENYFPGADISVRDIDTGGDIQIFIGTDHTSVRRAQ